MTNTVTPSFIDIIRSNMYNTLFHPNNPISTPNGFKKIIETIENGSSILDVGCGDGLYYTDASICQLIIDKKLIINGIDIDDGAIAICNKRIKLANMENQITAQSIDLLLIKEKYDVVLFMESFPVIPINNMKTYTSHALHISPKILMYHNLINEKYISSRALNVKRWIKPLIQYITLVDFGKITTTNEMWEFINKTVPNSKCSINILLSSTVAEALRLPKLCALGPLGYECDQYLIKITRSNN